MADIAQAAKWMREGREVRRPDWGRFRVRYSEEDGLTIRTPHTRLVSYRIPLDDLLADDWEIAEEGDPIR